MTNKEIRKSIDRAFYDYYKNKKMLMNGDISGEKYKKVLLWNIVVERTLTYFSQNKERTAVDSNIIKLHYFERQTEVYICNKFFIHQRTLYSWLNAVKHYAGLIAAQMGLISV